MAKLKMKKGIRVRLKKEKHSDGVIQKSLGRGKWHVCWDAGSLAGKTTEQTTQSITFWQAGDAPDLDEGEFEEEGGGVSDSDSEGDNSIKYQNSKAKFEKHRDNLVGKSHVVKDNKKKGESVTWTFVKSGSFKKDYFKKVPGPIGKTRQTGKFRQQTNVLKDCIYKGRRGDLLKVWLKLYPGDIHEHVARVTESIQAVQRNAAPVTVGEWVVFKSLLYAGALQPQSGNDLFDQKPERPFRKNPGFARFMRRNRFNLIKAHSTAAFRDDERKGTDKWYRIRKLIEDFNENRLRTVNIPNLLVPDEAMSPFRPRTTSSSTLDHISYVDRKPKPMGTEFKCVCDGRSGLMIYLEIQEGSTAMKEKKFRDELAPASAIGMRMALGATGQLS